MATVRVVPTTAPDVESRIVQMTQTFVRCFNEGDFDTIASLYAEDAICMPPNQRSAPGIESIKELFKWFRNAGTSNLKLTPTHIVQGTEFVLTNGTYSVNTTLPNGTAFTDLGKYLCVYEKQNNGEYKVLYDCWNSDVPVPMTH